MSPKKNYGRGWKKQRQVEHLAEIKNKYYIFCEGEKTEPNYFKGFKQYIELNSIYKNLVLIEVEGLGTDTERIINHAIEFVENNNIKNAQIWCVYDKDSFPAENFNKVSETAKNLNNSQKDVKYCVAWSNQCIEYWFVLHFNYYDVDNERPYYIDNLTKNFKAMRLPAYDKAKDEKIFDKLTFKGNPKLAIRYAKRRIAECCGKNDASSSPATRVYELVEELANYLPEGVKERYI
jgi:hypothetical protein